MQKKSEKMNAPSLSQNWVFTMCATAGFWLAGCLEPAGSQSASPLLAAGCLAHMGKSPFWLSLGAFIFFIFFSFFSIS